MQVIDVRTTFGTPSNMVQPRRIPIMHAIRTCSTGFDQAYRLRVSRGFHLPLKALLAPIAKDAEDRVVKWRRSLRIANREDNMVHQTAHEPLQS